MSLLPRSRIHLPARSRAFYQKVLDRLTKAKVPFLVGGAFAMEHYAGIWRYTKDLDIFMRPGHIEAALTILQQASFQVELTFPHWLAKVYQGHAFVDVIFSSGNGVAQVDDDWFKYAKTGKILGLTRKICPIEEMIWSKSFIMERERFDGADVAHLILTQCRRVNWERLLQRFGPHWEIFLSHLVLFGFIYPGMRNRIPDWVMRRLIRKLLAVRKKAPRHAFQGTLLSREQYLIDLQHWGYSDARLRPNGTMSPQEVAIWTNAIEKKAQ
jgi:hypothetical protein